jgi:hypothetical protein
MLSSFFIKKLDIFSFTAYNKDVHEGCIEICTEKEGIGVPSFLYVFVQHNIYVISSLTL